MKSKLTQEISNYCRLDFSNEIIREPKVLFYTKNIPQKPINFRKKCEKKSLKCINAEKILNAQKNPQKQPIVARKDSLKQGIKIRSQNIHRSDEKPIKKIQYKIQSGKQLPQPIPQIKQKFHRSLERQPVRKEEKKRNIIEELKNYHLNVKQRLRKEQRPAIQQIISIPQIYKNLPVQSSGNLRKTMNFLPIKFEFHDKLKAPGYSSFINQKNSSTEFSYPSQTAIISSQEIPRSPRKQFIELQAPISPFSSPLRMSKVPILQKTPIICVSEPQPIKQFTPNVRNEIKRPPSLAYSQKFQKIYGQFQLEDQIKKDLIASVEYQPMRSHFEHKYSGPDQLMKQHNSQKSTALPSELKLRKIQSEGDFIESVKLTQQSHFASSKPTPQQNIRYIDDFLHQSEPYQSNNPQTSKFKAFDPLYEQGDFLNQPEDESYQINVNGEDFKESYQNRENFKSIISVNSECGSSSSESEDSIIINNHPKEIISNRPIRTLF